MRVNRDYLLRAGQALLISMVPVLALAQTFGGVLTNVQDTVQTLINFSVPVVGTIFIWGAITLATSAGNETKRKRGIAVVIYSLIGLVLIVSVWGIVTLATSTFGVEGTAPAIPQVAPR